MSLEDYMEVQHNNFEASSASKSGSNSSKSKLPTKYPYLLNSHTVFDIHQKCLIGQKLSIFLLLHVYYRVAHNLHRTHLLQRERLSYLKNIKEPI